MKKLMFAALAVAGMSAFAEAKYVAVEKLALTLKSINPAETKVVTEKVNGFVFTKADGAQEVYTWTTADKLGADEWPDGAEGSWKSADGKKIKVTKAYPLVNLGEYSEGEVINAKDSKKQGKKIAFGKDYVAFGTGSYAGGTGFLIAKESISGNIVAADLNKYGTWKVSYDNATTKLMAEKGWTVKDVLGKNKVEFWDTAK